MTQKRIDQLIAKLQTFKEPRYSRYLSEILTRWKQGDFRRLDNEHNYLWESLNVNIGNAMGIKDRKGLPTWTIDN